LRGRAAGALEPDAALDAVLGEAPVFDPALDACVFEADAPVVGSSSSSSSSSAVLCARCCAAAG
jgi:hypothetical protein